MLCREFFSRNALNGDPVAGATISKARQVSRALIARTPYEG
jgi:hypothetical protein